MAKEINITDESQIGGVLTVQLLTKKNGLNKGKGYSIDLVRKVRKGVRKNEEVSSLFKMVIRHRNELLK